MIDPLLWIEVEIENTDDERMRRGLLLVSTRLRELMRDHEEMSAHLTPTRDDLIRYVNRIRNAANAHLKAPQWDREEMASTRADLNEAVLINP